MERRITLEELHELTSYMAKNKVPGKDGVPVKFFLALWDEISPILLEVLLDGLVVGSLNPKLTMGLFILLPKKGDQLLVGNKRGLTLLNCALKIYLSKVLQGFILEHQNAFLPGRSIHKSIMLTNEVLHKAKQSLSSFVLMKVDTIKAFDCLGWLFLTCLLEYIGFEWTQFHKSHSSHQCLGTIYCSSARQ